MVRGRFEEGIELTQRALEPVPGDDMIDEFLAWAYVVAGRLDMADRLLDQMSKRMSGAREMPASVMYMIVSSHRLWVKSDP